jgi:hypothetical protein
MRMALRPQQVRMVRKAKNNTAEMTKREIQRQDAQSNRPYRFLKPRE